MLLETTKFGLSVRYMERLNSNVRNDRIEIANKGKARTLIPGMNGINKGTNHKRQNSLQNNSAGKIIEYYSS